MRTPDDLQRFIDENGIEAQLLREIGDTPTVPAAAAALSVEPDRILKTLLFLAQKPGDRDAPPAPFVVISHGERRVEKRPLADLHGVGIKRIKLAPPDVVLQLLGYPAGGVPPFGHCTAVAGSAGQVDRGPWPRVCLRRGRRRQDDAAADG